MGTISQKKTAPDYGSAKKAAIQLLEKFAVDKPPVDPVEIARALNVKVFFVEFSTEDQNISGFYDADEDALFINKEEFPLRQTFTVAHELGHKILHEEWARSSDYRVLLRDQDAESNDPYEQEANSFAANLLVPRYLLDKYWKEASIEDLSRIFSVSVPVIKNRLAFEYGIR